MRAIACGVAMLALALFTTGAEAKRGAAVVNWGDEIFDVGPLALAGPETRVGKLCQHVGLFWADIATWNCRLVLTNADLTRYGEIPDSVKAIVEPAFANVTPQRGWWNGNGAYVFLGLLALGLAAKLRGSRASSEADAAVPMPGAPAPLPSPATVPARATFGRRGLP